VLAMQGDLKLFPMVSECLLILNPLRMLIAYDSGAVVMKVETRRGVCNNSPAEAISSENG